MARNVVYVSGKGLSPSAGMGWFMQWVIPEPNSGCWLWGGPLNAGGYGSVRHDGRTRNAHRVSWELARGRKIPPGMDLDHKCRTRSCVNPDHLEPVTRSENLKRGRAGEHNSAPTHCARGHLLSDHNVYLHPKRGTRMCVRCQRDRVRKWRARKAKETVNHG